MHSHTPSPPLYTLHVTHPPPHPHTALSGSYWLGTFQKVGIQPEVVRCGKYKAAADMLAAEGMSEEHREQLQALLEETVAVWSEVGWGGMEDEGGGGGGGSVGSGADVFVSPLFIVHLGMCGVLRQGLSAPACDPCTCSACTLTTPRVTTKTLITTHVQAVAAGRGKTTADVHTLLHGCVWDVQALVEQGWLDGLLYEDEVLGKLHRALGVCGWGG